VTAHTIVRIVAPNPSPMTLEGTNSYVVIGERGAIAIDPGPADDAHARALVAAASAGGVTIGAVAVTHGHPDHAPGAALLHAMTGAPVYAHVDAAFPHDRTLRDGEHVTSSDAELLAYESPGHARDHLVFWHAAERALFTGDVVVGRGTVVVAPPGGDMRAYVATLRRLRTDFAEARVLLGGHGPPVDDPRAKLDEYVAHREARERAIVDALRGRERTIPEIVTNVYASTPRPLWPAAARQVLAHLIALEREGHVRSRPLARVPDADERAMLDPDLSALVDRASIAVARAELGYDRAIDSIASYTLAARP